MGQVKRAIASCKEVGLKTGLFLIIGLPADFGDLSGRTIHFLEETQPDTVCVNSFIPLPGSDIFEYPARYGVHFRNNYDLADLKMRLGSVEGEANQDFVIEYNEMTNEQLKQERAKVLEYVKANSMEEQQ